MSQPLVSCIWYEDNNAEEAAEFYTGIFPDGKVTQTDRYPSESPSGNKVDEVMTVSWEMNGMQFMGLNGGKSGFKHSEAISFVVPCESQEEVDRYSEALTADGGEQGPCGWVKDKFGVSWQINPIRLDELLRDSDREAAKRAMECMLKMNKLNIAELEAAFKGE